jgi:presenilin-like A22 family membrane protease
MNRIAHAKTAKSPLFLIAALALTLIALGLAAEVRCSVGEAADSNPMVVRVAPLAIIDHSLGQESTFSVNVRARDASRLHGFVVGMRFNAGLVECADVKEGELLKAFNTTALFSATNSTAGTVQVSVNLTSSGAEAEGNGTLFELTFRVKGEGETVLDIYEVSVYDSSGTLLPYVVYDGYFNNKFLYDFAMPLTLFAVTFASLWLNQKTEGRLRATFEEKQFAARDAVLLVVMMGVMVSLIAFASQYGLMNPLMILFLFSYSMLLFIFTYLFTKKWYAGVVPPAVFVALYLLLRGTPLWSDYLVNIYGVVFAVMITLYMATLFSWKTTCIFTGLVTIADVVLVFVTEAMVRAAEAGASLGLPIAIAVPVVPVVAYAEGDLLRMMLGLGDFFFAGLLTIQSFKRYGKKFAIAAVAAMTASFAVFEIVLLNYFQRAFPATLMIILGWAVVVGVREIASHLKQNQKGTK